MNRFWLKTTTKRCRGSSGDQSWDQGGGEEYHSAVTRFSPLQGSGLIYAAVLWLADSLLFFLLSLSLLSLLLPPRHADGQSRWTAQLLFLRVRCIQLTSHLDFFLCCFAFFVFFFSGSESMHRGCIPLCVCARILFFFFFFSSTFEVVKYGA